MKELVQVKNIKKYYPAGHKTVDGKREKTYVKAIDDVSFSVMEGETLGIVGESGCGKSTLGRCVLKLIDSTSGEIIFDEEDISRHTPSQMRKRRKNMQMIFQNPFLSFNPKMSIGKSLRDVAKFYELGKAEAETRIDELLEYVNLDKSVLARHSNELSGGQLQRLAIVRALIPNPRFIIADEPVSALDVSVQAQILNLFYDLKETCNLTMMFISHELTIVESICDNVMVMYLGSVVELGEAEELFRNTLHPYTKALISSKPKEYPEQEKERLILSGDVPNAMEIPAGCRFCTRCPVSVQGKCDVDSPPLKKVANRHWVACHLVESMEQD